VYASPFSNRKTLLWVSDVDVCVEIVIWLTMVSHGMFPFRYDGEERLFCVADEMNEGVVKLFQHDAVVEDGGHNTLAAFRV